MTLKGIKKQLKNGEISIAQALQLLGKVPDSPAVQRFLDELTQCGIEDLDFEPIESALEIPNDEGV